METSKEDYELFKSECRKWRDILGLQSWELFWIHGDTDSGNRAEVYADQAGRIATVYFADKWEEDAVTETLIKKMAFHEMWELLLNDLRVLAACFFSEKMVEEEIHKIIRTMENVLFPKYNQLDEKCELDCKCKHDDLVK